jgi:predicted DNA-binding transcriptional regulator AlpA
MQSLLTVELLASKIHKSVTSIRSDVARNPKSLPPICRLPGTKRLLWREEDVNHWIARHVTNSNDDISTLVTDTAASVVKPKRGRPTKAQQIAAQSLASRTSNQIRSEKAC